MKREDKIRIMARAFYQDNQDQYEDYHEALSEFMTNDKVSDIFLDGVIKPFIKKEEGHILFTRDDGHVISLREEDMFVAPITEMTEDEGMDDEEKNHELAQQYPELGPVEMLEKMGWRKLELSND